MKRRNFDLIYDLSKIALDRFGEIPDELYEAMKVVAEEDLLQAKSVAFVCKVITEGVRNGSDSYNIRYALECLGYEVTD